MAEEKETVVEQAGTETITVNDQELAAAVARGDVIPEAEAEVIDPDILAEIAEDSSKEIAVDEAAKKDDSTIPRARFNEVNEENKLLKAQLESLKQPAAATAIELDGVAVENPREKIKELRKLQKNLELEGDEEESLKVSDQIDDLLLRVATIQAENNIKSSMSVQNQQVKLQESLNSIAETAYTTYPFLDINSPDVDYDAVLAVNNRTTEFRNEGHTATEALKQAINEKGPKFAALIGKPVMTKGDQVREQRERSAKEKASNASISQPARLPDRGEKESFELNIKNLTDAQIKALPEETKARLRGDVV